jgi:hypothetical protein
MAYIIKYNSTSEECDNVKEEITTPISIDIEGNKTVVIDFKYFCVPNIQVNCANDNNKYELFTYIMKEKDDNQDNVIRCNKLKDQINNLDYFQGTNQIYFQIVGVKGIVIKNTSQDIINVQIMC